MKYKYKFVSNYYVYEDDLLEEFRQMSLKGYSLKEVGYFFYKFERDDHIYKYQFDYQTPSEEYLATIKALEYEYLGKTRNLHIYRHRDENAVDLHTDERTHRLLLLDHYGIPLQVSVFTLFVIGMFTVNMNRSLVQWNIHDFYVHYQTYFLIIMAFLFSVTCLCVGGSSVLLDKIQETHQSQYIKIRQICCILERIFFSLTIGLGFILPFFNLRGMYFVFAMAFLVGVVLIYKVMHSHFKKPYQLGILLYVACIFLPQGLKDIQQDALLPVQEYYSYGEYQEISKETNPFMIYYTINDLDHSYFEEKYLCKNDHVKERLMQYLIIESEQLDRTQEQFDQPQSQPVEFSFPTRLSYQQALQKFKQAKVGNVTYYRLNHIVIAYLDKTVVRYAIEDEEDIMKFIQFTFNEGEK